MLSHIKYYLYFYTGANLKGSDREKNCVLALYEVVSEQLKYKSAVTFSMSFLVFH